MFLCIELTGDSKIKVIKTVKANYPKTPIIIYTSVPQTIYKISFLKAGAAGYFSKEVNKKIIIEAIKKVARNRYHTTSNFTNKIDNIYLKQSRKDFGSHSPREVQFLKLLTEGERNIKFQKKKTKSC